MDNSLLHELYLTLVGLQSRALHLFIALLVFFVIIDRVQKVTKSHPSKWQYFKAIFTDTILMVSNRLIGKILSVVLGISLIEMMPVSPLASLTSKIMSYSIVLQVAFVLLCIEFTTYWLHRLYHVYGYLWDIHKVHHSPENLVWSNTFRTHILQQAIYVPVLGTVSYLVVPKESMHVMPIVFMTALSYTMFIHSNFKLSYGWFNRIFTSPCVHHWHHSETLVDKNFGGIFSFYDWIFGTLYLPEKGEYPEKCGIGKKSTNDFITLWLLPFREWSARISKRKKAALNPVEN